MLAELYPLQVLLMTFSDLVNRHQADVVAYLIEENRVLKEQMALDHSSLRTTRIYVDPDEQAITDKLRKLG